MASKKHYIVNQNNYTVEAVLEELTAKDKKDIKDLRELGFKFILKEKTPEPKLTPEQELEKRKNNPFSEMNVKKYIEANASKEQKAEYQKLYNEQAKDSKTGMPLFYKKDTPDGKHKAGEPRVKGHIATLGWFKKEFPNYEESFNNK